MVVQKDKALVNYDKGIDIKLNVNTFYGDILAGKISDEPFEGAFEFQSNLKLDDFSSKKIFPEDEKSIRKCLGSISWFYTSRAGNNAARNHKKYN